MLWSGEKESGVLICLFGPAVLSYLPPLAKAIDGNATLGLVSCRSLGSLLVYCTDCTKWFLWLLPGAVVVEGCSLEGLGLVLQPVSPSPDVSFQCRLS
jgi:hypothetical protein